MRCQGVALRSSNLTGFVTLILSLRSAMLGDAEVVVYKQYHTPGVKRVIASGSRDMNRLNIERQLLEIVGPHERIIGLKKFSEKGLYLERALSGPLAQYLLESGIAPPSIQQQMTWCREAAEAVAWVHARGVIHCDIQPTNFLVDKNLHLKLSDFQGKQISQDGSVLLDGGSGEPCRFYCPRADPFEADIKTDLFALGYGWYEKARDRFAKYQFPQDALACSSITLKCWRKEYEPVQELIRDLEAIEKGI
ncbi:Pc21g12320 [Talaromyces islandicus]|uniref:Pc21g12320 n=1 Tax=Talaromyces islandicus TaxID=28573 RepID=A0A0U1LKR3_TALIS|nr:Pc21g12320 [Talaromyces islandicus]